MANISKSGVLEEIAQKLAPQYQGKLVIDREVIDGPPSLGGMLLSYIAEEFRVREKIKRRNIFEVIECGASGYLRLIDEKARDIIEKCLQRYAEKNKVAVSL